MNKPRSSKLWLWVVAACALQLAAWAIWLTIASKHKVAEVPLQPKPAVSNQP
ncbi:MAG: hypothetical protein RLZZ129_2458 [Verrucomicrobiota bacterium]|jgi:hypothetical protein|nr:hypothetical protein [Opitutaceae bacterium]HRJ48054.1 hypothetical protein [Opitutaceae bacterium]